MRLLLLQSTERYARSQVHLKHKIQKDGLFECLYLVSLQVSSGIRMAEGHQGGQVGDHHCQTLQDGKEA